MSRIAIFKSKSQGRHVVVRRSSRRSRRLPPCDALWLVTRVDCVTILSFQLLDFPGSLICWMQRVSPELFYKQPVSLSHFLHSQFQIQKGPHLLVPHLLRQVSSWHCLSTHPRYASCSRAWELDAASDFEFLPILLSSFPVAMSISGLLDAIGLFDDEELVGTWEDRFCHKSFFSFLLLHPFRYRVGAACQAGSLSAASRAEMADVEHMKKIIFYSSRVNLPLSECLRVDVWYQCIESEF